MVVPAGPSRDGHEAATWTLKWPRTFSRVLGGRCGEEEVSKARWGGPRRTFSGADGEIPLVSKLALRAAAAHFFRSTPRARYEFITHLFLVFAFASLGVAADKARQGQDDDIREAVFRYQFDHNASGQQKSANVYFIGVGEKATDPSDEFLKRFAGHKPPVRKASASHFVRGKGLLDKKTGEQGLAFRATTIKWISDTEVEVSGGYYEAELSSSGNTYTVKKENGKWKVTKNKMNWIS